MKLRNLFLSTLVVCVCASCSKDDDSIKGPVEPVDAYISIAATSLTQTKAALPTLREGSTDVTPKTDIGSDDEKFISTLTAYVFKNEEGDQSLSTIGTAKSENGQSVTEIKHIPIKVTPDQTDPRKPSSSKFIVILVANGKLLTPKNLEEFKSLTLTDDISTCITNKRLPMVSESISCQGLIPIVKGAGEDGASTIYAENWITKDKIISFENSITDSSDKPDGVTPIELTRLVARVQVDKITFNYPDELAQFELENLSIVNVHSTSTFEEGDGEYVKGYVSDKYSPADKWISENSPIKDKLAQAYTKCILGKGEKAAESIDWLAETVESKYPQFISYAFSNPENVDHKTALLISGKFIRNSNAPDVKETRNFRVFLDDPKDSGGPMVKRNHIYKLNVTITGEGSSNEDKIELNAHVSAEITVANWSIIEQTEEDAN
ncbi:fimbrial protein [Parabacteroides timonensis]|uniref:fimbrial protein n=1 Tax=Parabacteroides timonensis TaxID=1871013 RepID=UPI00094E9C58|nr:fimbrial protein [Parabacteroides timonensis]